MSMLQAGQGFFFDLPNTLPADTHIDSDLL
jgi:hypothetical protein